MSGKKLFGAKIPNDLIRDIKLQGIVSNMNNEQILESALRNWLTQEQTIRGKEVK